MIKSANELETSVSICGVKGRMTSQHKKGGALWASQTLVTETRQIAFGENEGYYIKAKIRFDDECDNGHNSFSITGEINARQSFAERTMVTCGCIHDDIAAHFPELAHLIKWHLCSTDSPMHYVANTVYLAGDRDCSGKRKGEPARFETHLRFKDFPISFKPKKVLADFLKEKEGKEINDFELVIVPVPHKDKGKPGEYQFSDQYTFAGCTHSPWTYAPFDTLQQAEEFAAAIKLGYSFEQVAVAFSEGKPRDLDAARSAGVWPDATDEQLSVDPEELKAALLDRLPALIAEMKKDIESAGLEWSAE